LKCQMSATSCASLIISGIGFLLQWIGRSESIWPPARGAVCREAANHYKGCSALLWQAMR
jgi:hypothetical protein